MNTSPISPLLPALHSIVMVDWLPKLGEKAFLAWLRLHSWKKESDTSPYPIPLSFNRIIKRLRVGNTTFYEHILRPLWNYGLIDLRQTAAKKKELILFAFPLNNPEKSTSPLLPLRDYDLDLPADDSPLLVEEVAKTAPEKDFPAKIVLPCEPDKEVSSHPEGHSLPSVIQQAIQSDSPLLEREQSLIEVYEKCKNDSRYTDEFFLQKARTCVCYPHDPKKFAAYLYKSILNEWNRSPVKVGKRHPVVKAISAQRPPDVPIWVWRQQQAHSQQKNELTPEQKAKSEHLLRLLGECP